MRTVYFDCSAGISADMAAAALLDLGADAEKLKEAIHSIYPESHIVIDRDIRNGISAATFTAEMPEESASYEEHTLPGITEKIMSSSMPEGAKKNAVTIFNVLAQAESKIHNIPVNYIHFHEVGSPASVIDICAVSFCLENLNIERVTASPLTDGTGQIKCAHGIIPVPVPAVMAICEANAVPMNIADISGEMVTPTGAAIIAALTEAYEPPRGAVVKKNGYSAGKRIFPNANVLRATLFEEDSEDSTHDQIVLLETNIDDCSSEVLGFCLEKLFEAGVRDAWFTPIYMKKNRPAYSLSIMCKPEAEEEAIRTVFLHTTAIGMRRTECSRVIMNREKASVMTPYGEADAKRCTYGDIEKTYIEYDSAKKLAEENNISILEIYRNN